MNKNENPPVYVTSPLLPNIDEYKNVLHDIWESRYLTNNGAYCQKLESELNDYLDVATTKLCNNGTTALMVALKMFDLPPGSEVITTPFTFAATAHAISWLGLKPIFVDILPETLTIDPDAVEKAISSNTSAILAVHVYGTVCEVDALQAIADKYELNLIYDAAHAFGVTVDDQPIASYGDASIFSFHATKLFNTVEGGMVATNNPEHDELISLLNNFGIKNENEVDLVGVNGKMNELQAAFGLLTLPLVGDEKQVRRKLRSEYDDILEDLPGIKTQVIQPGVEGSEQYYPVIINKEKFGRSRDDIYEELKVNKIFARKYFYPICTDFKPYLGNKVISTSDVPYVDIVKHQVLCLPFHSGVTQEAVSIVRDVFLKV